VTSADATAAGPAYSGVTCTATPAGGRSLAAHDLSWLREHIPADPTGRTEVPGMWVVGNVTDLAAQGGTAAAAQINADLVAEETRRAVATWPDPFSAESEARLGERVMDDRRSHGL
jgi:hypothetical protein